MTSPQLPLIVEDYNEAIRATVVAIGGFKRVGATLKPELPADQAGRWLSDCCNPDRRDVLPPEQLGLIRRMAREANVHVLAAFEARDAGYSDPQPLDFDKAATDLEMEFVGAVDRLEAMTNRISELRARARKRA